MRPATASGKRLDEHQQEYLAGRYRLWDPEAYGRGQWVLVWKGWQQFGKPSNVTLEAARAAFSSDRERLDRIAHALLRRMEVVLLPVDEGRLRQRIEYAVIEALVRTPSPGRSSATRSVIRASGPPQNG